MFKNKFFLYGLGTGLIAAAIIIQLASLSQHASSEDIEWAEFFHEHFAEISAAAAEQGYSLNNEATNNEWVQQQHEEQSLNDADQLPMNQEQSNEQHDRDNNEVDSTDVSSSDQWYELTITSGMTSIEVAALAEQLGLVSDHQLLEDALAEKGLSQYIQIGTFTFQEPPQLDDLIAAITKR